jgi:hypothetical protein
MAAFQKLIGRSLYKPLKIDVRDHCEYNVQGCISRTFDIPRRELIALLSSDEASLDIVDRIDVIEFPDEDRCVMYNPSRMDRKGVSQVRDRAENVTHWDPDGQYGEWSARSM